MFTYIILYQVKPCRKFSKFCFSGWLGIALLLADSNSAHAVGRSLLTACKRSLRMLCFNTLSVSHSIHRGLSAPGWGVSRSIPGGGVSRPTPEGGSPSPHWAVLSQHTLRQTPRLTATGAGGTHPTRMHSCLNLYLYLFIFFNGKDKSKPCDILKKCHDDILNVNCLLLCNEELLTCLAENFDTLSI